MGTITLVQYLTALQGALRAVVSLCALVLVLLCTNRRSHILAFKYLLFFIIVMGIWGFFGSIFFIYPDSSILPKISPFIYASISFGGPTFMLFCFAYVFPSRPDLVKSLHWVLIFPWVFSIFVLSPSLQKYSIIFTDELIYIPYRDILEHYNFMFYVHIIYGYFTVLVGIGALSYKAMKHPSKTTKGSKFAIVAALLFIAQNMVASFGDKDNNFFWIPSITVVVCMVLLFLTLYYDTAEQIIFKGQSALLETIPFPVIIFNNNDIALYSNSKGKELFASTDKNFPVFQKKLDILKGFTSFEFDSVDLPETAQGGVTKFIQQKDSKTLFLLQEHEIKDDEQVKSRGHLMMMVPLTSMQTFFTTLEDKAFKDSLCDCYNGHFLQLKQKQPILPDLFPVSLIMCDIDNLKVVNDILGHAKGDEYILACYNQIHSNVRKDDMIFRLGGDEFLVILLKTPAREAQAIACSIEFGTKQLTGFEPYKIGMSVGTATATSINDNIETCVHRADEEMYKMKALHKGKS